MSLMRLVCHLLLVGAVSIVSGKDVCSDLIDDCSELQGICIGSVLKYHYDVLTSLAKQMNNSSIPALQNFLPFVQSNIPLVLSPDQDYSTVSTVSSTNIDDTLKQALPLLKESLPLIRESLPLVRESLPLIRHYLSPLANKSSCQQKATCRTCKECPKLRESLISFVETLCPNTCKVCSSNNKLSTSVKKLAGFF